MLDERAVSARALTLLSFSRVAPHQPDEEFVERFVRPQWLLSRFREMSGHISAAFQSALGRRLCLPATAHKRRWSVL
jgi:hypothetical protein